MTAFRIFAMLLLAGLMASCSTKPQHVSPAEFQKQWEMRHAQTVHWCSYLGVTNGHVCIVAEDDTARRIEVERGGFFHGDERLAGRFC